MSARTVCITGGAGFVGANLTREALQDEQTRVVVLDKLTYAGRRDSLPTDDRLTFVHGDINDGPLVAGLLAEHRPAAVLHLAAESHVDRSIDAPAAFVETNVNGTLTMLQRALEHWESLPAELGESFRFVHASTDEVFGSIDGDARFTESSPYQPNSPYSASKAASDHLARAFHKTYGLPTVTCHSSNNYGPHQHPEKLIPRMVLCAARELPLPIYGDGLQVRDWLHVSDNSRALLLLAQGGTPGGVYLAGADQTRANLELVRDLCATLDELAPRAAGSHADLIEFVDDRPGHDRRYALDSSKLRDQLGWTPKVSFADGLCATVRWCLEHRDWMAASAGPDGARRLGLRR